MKQVRIPIRVVFYREDDLWIAHCLEFDLLGHGRTIEEAFETLNQAIAIQFEDSVEHSNPDNLFTPAEGKYFRMFAEGERVAFGELRIGKMEDVVEGLDMRRYDDGLVPA